VVCEHATPVPWPGLWLDIGRRIVTLDRAAGSGGAARAVVHCTSSRWQGRAGTAAGTSPRGTAGRAGPDWKAHAPSRRGSSCASAACWTCRRPARL